MDALLLFEEGVGLCGCGVYDNFRQCWISMRGDILLDIRDLFIDCTDDSPF